MLGEEMDLGEQLIEEVSQIILLQDKIEQGKTKISNHYEMTLEQIPLYDEDNVISDQQPKTKSTIEISAPDGESKGMRADLQKE